MAQDTSGRKTAFLGNCVAAAVLLKNVRDLMKSLAEEQSNDATISGIVQNDILGANSHLTPTIVNNFLQVVQPAIEANIHLANLLAMLPN